MKNNRWTFKITVGYVPLPPEKEEAYWTAQRYMAGILRKEMEARMDDMPICPECGSYLHLTTEGKHVCRNEICTLYDIAPDQTEVMNGKSQTVENGFQSDLCSTTSGDDGSTKGESSFATGMDQGRSNVEP